MYITGSCEMATFIGNTSSYFTLICPAERSCMNAVRFCPSPTQCSSDSCCCSGYSQCSGMTTSYAVTTEPTLIPTDYPIYVPTNNPTVYPTFTPSSPSTNNPTNGPTNMPSKNPMEPLTITRIISSSINELTTTTLVEDTNDGSDILMTDYVGVLMVLGAVILMCVMCVLLLWRQLKSMETTVSETVDEVSVEKKDVVQEADNVHSTVHSEHAKHESSNEDSLGVIADITDITIGNHDH
eukprot:741429_1